ncbi:hypothetical protein I4U23_010592 [Adineta vaga]|nr:hypothetical protein I4U23_010592 [Adineta vaga]
MFHADPSYFDTTNTNHIEQEVQVIIRESILKFNDLTGNKSSYRHIFILGGLNNTDYELLNDQLIKMRKNCDTIIPLVEQLAIDDLQKFLKSIDYSCLTMNLYAVDIVEKQGLVPITDFTAVCDTTVSPAVFFFAIFYDLEKNLGGDRRKVQPQYFFSYDFNNKYWNIIKNNSCTSEPDYFVELMHKFNDNNSDYDTENVKHLMMTYLSKLEY